MDLAFGSGPVAGMGRTRSRDRGACAVMARVALVASLVSNPVLLRTWRKGEDPIMQVQVVKVPRIVGKILQVVLGFWSKDKK